MPDNDPYRQFWDTLFEPDEHTCFGSNLRANDVTPVAENTAPGYPFYGSLQYFSINAMIPGSTRAISNVISFRNFLVEFDTDPSGNKISRENQLKALKKSGMPWSTAVWSGSKSIHFILSLEKPLQTHKLYSYVADWIHRIVTLSDPSTIDPGRFSRVPGGVNSDKTGLLQELMRDDRGRVPNEVFEDWLYSHPDQEPKAQDIQKHDKAGCSLRKAKVLKTVEEAEAYCRERWPLSVGNKQGAMFSWGIYLVGNTGLSDGEMIGLLASNDQGSDPKMSEYERVISRCMDMLDE